MSPWPANFFRGLIVLVLAAHVFYMYSLARSGVETFGFDLGTTIFSAMFALIMLIPLVWAVTLPELPEIYSTHYRARRWWSQGRCPTCGYDRRGVVADCCPECGHALMQPRGYRISSHTVRLFVGINLLAWMFGAATAEAWIELDELAFRREAEQLRSTNPNESYHRDAAWPNEGVLIWSAENGFEKVPFVLHDT